MCYEMRRENRIVNGKIFFEDTYNKKEIWDNKHALWLSSTFPSTTRSKQERRLPDHQIQGSSLTGQLSSWRRGLTPPGRRCGGVFIHNVLLRYA